MNNIKNIFIKLGDMDRRYIFILILLSVLIPLLKPNWVNIPIKTTKNSEIVFTEINNLSAGDKILISFEYGASTKPEIHPMSIALLNHLFYKGVKVYIVALWPDGVMMAADAINEVLDSKLFNLTEGYDYVNLGYKPGGQVVIRGIATDIRALYTQDINLTLLDEIPMMEGINNITDFDFVFDLSAGVPGNAEWVQYACDEYKIPLSSGCTSIMVTDAIPYVESGQLRGILAGMPGAAEYENLVYNYLSNNKENASTENHIDKNQEKYNKYNDVEWWRKNIDPSSTDLTKRLQSFLGIRVDGFFGYETEKYWIAVVDNHNNKILSESKNTYVADESISGFMNSEVMLQRGKATSRMSAQSITHLLMVVFIILGNISYYLKRKKTFIKEPV